MGLLVEHAGVWKESEPYLPHSGVFKPAEDGHIWDAGVWKEFYSGKTLVTVELSSGTWVFSPRTNQIETMVGQGGRGAPDQWATETVSLMNVLSTAPAGWDSVVFEQRAQGEFNKIGNQPEAGNTKSYNRHTFGPSGFSSTSYSQFLRSPTTKTGSAWGRSFTTPASASYTARISRRTATASRGPSTTGFGQTFQGGLGGTAAQRTVTNIPVNPGQSYPISVPSGGLLRITYYE